MAVKASSDAILNMANDIKKTVDEIVQIRHEIESARSKMSGWNDAKAAEFDSVMKRVAKLSEQPVDTLQQAIPKLKRLAQAVDQYNGVKFQ